LHGYNIFVDHHKLELIRLAFEDIKQDARSFADLGGVWKVNAGYTIFTLRNYNIERAFIVDTNYNKIADKKLARFDNLTKITGNFGDPDVIAKIKPVDVVYLFDVLLHQVSPNWDGILSEYARLTDCFLIFNQQFVSGEEAFRLMDLPLAEFKRLAPPRNDDLYDFIYAHKDEINPEHHRRWQDIPNVLPWAITDQALRARMSDLGYREAYFKNCGQFSNSDHFENHAFIFVKP